MALPVAPRRVVFVDDEYQRRQSTKRAAGSACDSCRRKKKRCAHALPLPGAELHDGAQAVSPTAAQQHHDVAAGTSSGQTSLSTPAEGSSTASRPYARFIGDLNPESELRGPQCSKNSVGVWHVEEHEGPDHARRTSAWNDTLSGSLFQHCSQLTRRMLLPIMEDQCLGPRPPEHHLQVLERFYFENVHPILPAVDQAVYQSAPPGSPHHVLQVQTLCLAVHTNPAVQDRLYLGAQDGLLAPAEFGRKLLSSMRLHMELSYTTDKALLIRTLATMSLFAYTRDSLELTCQFFVRAVHMSLTLGLHLQRAPDRDDPALDCLFCYVWAIDRLHAAMQGRPVMIHERDLPVLPMQRAKDQSPGLKVFVRLAALLDCVIDLYRPRSTAREVSSEHFPSFEDVLLECEALALPNQLLETLELLYHAIAILSCRRRSDLAESGTLAPSPRQQFSATQITAILEDEAGGSEQVILLPYVPYAASLSVSISHRQIRHSRVLSSKIRARKLILQNLRHLKSMGEYYWSAVVMAELARKSLEDACNIGGPISRTETDEDMGTTSAVQEEVPDRTQSRRQSWIDLGHCVYSGQQGDPSWRVNGPLDSQYVSSPTAGEWRIDDLDWLMDANLELSIPSVFPAGDVTFSQT